MTPTIRKFEDALKDHAYERSTKGRTDQIPMDIYNALSETLPYALVVKLGELILAMKEKTYVYEKK